MVRPLFRLLAVLLLALFGDAAHLWRVTICLVAGSAATVAIYRLWPGVLPLWPGVAVLACAAAGGALWEWRARRAAQARLAGAPR